MNQDADLLRRYVQTDCQDAFRELVDRYLDVVFAAARRQAGDAEMAQDVTQAVFMVLAKKAPQLRGERRLTGWLLRVTRYAANNALRDRSRRQHHERKAAEMTQTTTAAHGDQWSAISPLLDEGIARLQDKDRGVLLAKFFERQTTRELAEDLGISEAAAEKRISRAVEKLRDFFRKRGVVVSTDALTAGLIAGSAHAAPSGLSLAIASTATSTTVTSLAKGTLIAMAYAKTKTVTVAVILGLLLIGGGTVAIKAMKSPHQTSSVVVADPETASPWPVTFSDGTTVELLALTDRPGTPNQWWAPDGSIVPAPTPLPRNLLRIDPQPNVHIYQFSIRQTGATDRSLMITWNTAVASAGSEVVANTKGQTMLNLMSALADTEPTVDMKLQLGVGPWQPDERYELNSSTTQTTTAKTPRAKSLEIGAIVDRIIRQEKITTITVRRLAPQLFVTREEEVKVVTKDGKEFGTVGSTGRLLGISDYDFAVPRDQIVALIFRFRPYESRDIRNISLKPNIKTVPLSTNPGPL